MRLTRIQALMVPLLAGLLATAPVPRAGAAGLGESSAPAKWRAAAHAYQARQYDEAKRLYEELAEEGMNTPDLFFNLGNTYYQLGQKGMAAWMYEKALALRPRDGDARKNLRLAVGPQLDRSPQATGAFFLFRPVFRLYSSFTASEWMLVLDAAYFLAAFFAALWILSRPTALRRWTRRLAILGTAALVITAVFAIPRLIDAEWNRYGVVVQRGAIVRSAPGPNEPEYFEAREGERFLVTDADVLGWVRVMRPSDGRVGYLLEGAVRLIPSYVRPHSISP